MKKLLIMMCVLFIINLVAIIIPLWSSENTMIILYRMAYSFKMFKIICKTVKKACNIKKQVI